MTTDQANEVNLLKRQLYLEAGTNNRMLSDQEEHLVRAMHSYSLQTVDQLNSEISRLRSLHTMESERIRRYHQALSPHKKVPPEVLTEIFSHCVEGPIGKRISTNNTPWALLRVCSQWREVIKRAQFLTIQVGQYDYCWDTMSDIFSTFRNSKLNLGFIPGYWLFSGLITNIIIPFAPRITELSIELPEDPESGSELAKSQYTPFDSLQTLTVMCASPPPAAFFEILRRSPALVRLTLLYDVNITALPITNPKNSKPIAPIVLPNLSSIELLLRSSFPSSHSVGASIECIVAPSLRHITIHDGIELVWEPFPAGAFRSLVYRPSCPLDSLEVDIDLPEEELKQLLEVAPLLRSLHLGDRNKISGLILGAIADGRLLSRLERLECHTGTPEAFSSLLNLLEKRHSMGSVLRGSAGSRVHMDDFFSILDALDPEILKVFSVCVLDDFP